MGAEFGGHGKILPANHTNHTKKSNLIEYSCRFA
jgi:hypothetical protein